MNLFNEVSDALYLLMLCQKYSILTKHVSGRIKSEGHLRGSSTLANVIVKEIFGKPEQAPAPDL